MIIYILACINLADTLKNENNTESISSLYQHFLEAKK